MSDAPVLYRFDSLSEPALLHGVSSRLGGASQGRISGLNLGHTVGDDAQAVAHNHALLYEALGLRPQQVVSARQVHGAHVARVGAFHGGTVIADTDGLITDEPDTALLMRFADCVPVLLYDPERGAIGLAHAGWKGTLARVAAHAAQALVQELGCRPADIRAAIGPSIGPCCYEVGPEVVAATREAFPAAPTLISRERASGHAYLNLWAAVAWQLREVGIEQIETARLCTSCRSDLFYSHRAQGPAAGRFAAVIALRAVDV
jgi:polyphenol oxidase